MQHCHVRIRRNQQVDRSMRARSVARRKRLPQSTMHRYGPHRGLMQIPETATILHVREAGDYKQVLGNRSGWFKIRGTFGILLYMLDALAVSLGLPLEPSVLSNLGTRATWRHPSRQAATDLGTQTTSGTAGERPKRKFARTSGSPRTRRRVCLRYTCATDRPQGHLRRSAYEPLCYTNSS